VSTYDVVVTWLDGKQETYGAEKAFVEKEVLQIHPVERYGTMRYVPLANVRIFTVDKR